MPFYEYQCSACSHHVEVLQKISDAPLRKCPDCGKSAMKRLISAPVFRLKGGGWYETDFKSDSEQKRNIAGREETETEAKASDKGDAKESKDTAAAGDAKPADSKPEAKSETKAEASPERKSVSRSTKTARPVSKPQASKPQPAKPQAGKPKASKAKAPKKKAKRR